MQPLLSFAGTALGVLGVVACLVSGAARVSGAYTVAGYEAGTLFQLGIGLLVAACWAKLESVERLP